MIFIVLTCIVRVQETKNALHEYYSTSIVLQVDLPVHTEHFVCKLCRQFGITQHHRSNRMHVVTLKTQDVTYPGPHMCV